MGGGGARPGDGRSVSRPDGRGQGASTGRGPGGGPGRRDSGVWGGDGLSSLRTCPGSLDLWAPHRREGSLRDTDVRSLQAPHLPGVDAREHPRRSAWERGLGLLELGDRSREGKGLAQIASLGWFAVWGGPLRNTLRHRCLRSATAGAGLAGTDSVAAGQATEMKRRSLTPGRETPLALPRQSPDAMRRAFSGPQFHPKFQGLLAPTVWPKLVL